MLWKISLWRWKLKRWRKERREIKSLKRAIRKVDKEYAPRIARAENGYDEILIDNYIDEVSPYQPRLDAIKTRKLLEKARKMGIEVPAKNSEWFNQQENVYTEETYTMLSWDGEAKLRKLIRKQRRENMDWWLKIITAFTGLIGTLIGLIAILK
jgi:hypothetical protein